MPEGPEVTTITDALEDIFKGKKLLSLKILDHSKYANKSPNNYDLFVENLPLEVKKISNKGKFIYWQFDKGFYMFNHLNMSGIWLIKQTKYSSIEFLFANNKELYFDDVRKFGYIEFSNNKEDLEEKLKKLGPDILNDKKLTFKEFNNILNKHPKSNVTKVLMDQHIFSGIGNYLKSEILYASKINPNRNVNSLDENERKLLFHQSRAIIKESYDMGGASRRDYKKVDGQEGTFQDKFKVYSQKKDPYGNEVIRNKTKDGRTTYWVPDIQI